MLIYRCIFWKEREEAPVYICIDFIINSINKIRPDEIPSSSTRCLLAAKISSAILGEKKNGRLFFSLADGALKAHKKLIQPKTEAKQRNEQMKKGPGSLIMVLVEKNASISPQQLSCSATLGNRSDPPS